MNLSNGGPPPSTEFLLDPGWSDASRLFLENMILQNRGAIAAFDFDDTLLDGDLSLTLLNHRDPSGAALKDYERGCQEDVARAYAQLVETLIVGRRETDIRAEVLELFSHSLSTGALRLRPALIELIWAMQRNSWVVYIVTASPAVVISPVAQQLGIPADHVLGMWCNTDPKDRFCPPTQAPITYREGKVSAIQTAIQSKELTFAAGDAITDLELLEYASNQLVVDKGVAALRIVAEEKGWLIERDL